MNEIKYESERAGEQAFNFYEDGNKVGGMDISVDNKTLTVHRTHVTEGKKGKGYAGELIDCMIEFARKNELKVKPLCPFVNAQFKKEPTLYIDLWSSE
ncbi:GNAT family N-acetyltransferase [Pedobacter jamesrossensis]|uniref:GNAT family N-acetyltransferase n=1 Tax=Pedobacter jamesrossensis TaxID=1908238 RepID=A0ABV8NL80_9SPHI